MYQKKNNINFQLSIKDTLVLKSIAICAMLVHHVITCVPPGIETQFGYLSIRVGVLGKVCVAIFLYLSGYGLTLQFSKLAEQGKITMKKNLYFYPEAFCKILFCILAYIYFVCSNRGICFRQAIDSFLW